MAEKASWNFEPDTPIAEGRWVLKSLGGGNRYEVFLVWDEKLFAPVVAKVLRPDRVDKERSLAALRREAGLLERLAHPVLVRGFGAVLDGRCPHVLLEDVDGPTLRRLIKRHGALPLEQLLPLALHVASALHYLSTERVVHFDVKPGNIVMAVPPRLIDLSLARSFEEATQIKKPVGTASYMAPEVRAAPGSEGIGPAADVWSFGATLYEAITGRRVTEDPEPLAEDLPAGLTSLVMRMLADDPAERPLPSEVATVLESFV